MSIGVRPETKLAREAGLELGATGGIKVDARLATSDPDIFAVGDAIEVVNRVSGKPALIPLAGPANRQARIAADNMLASERRRPTVLRRHDGDRDPEGVRPRGRLHRPQRAAGARRSKSRTRP